MAKQEVQEVEMRLRDINNGDLPSYIEVRMCDWDAVAV